MGQPFVGCANGLTCLPLLARLARSQSWRVPPVVTRAEREIRTMATLKGNKIEESL